MARAILTVRLVMFLPLVPLFAQAEKNKRKHGKCQNGRYQ
jgi:hypothetical protein